MSPVSPVFHTVVIVNIGPLSVLNGSLGCFDLRCCYLDVSYLHAYAAMTNCLIWNKS